MKTPFITKTTFTLLNTTKIKRTYKTIMTSKKENLRTTTPKKSYKPQNNLKNPKYNKMKPLEN